MPKVVAPLTDREIQSLGAGLHSVGGVRGLKLQVTPPNGRSWIFRAKVQGKVQDMGLGNYPSVSLKTAREHAQRLREKIQEGINPLIEKQRLANQILAERISRKTFRECSETFIDEVLSKDVSRKSIQQWTNTLSTYAFPILGNIPVSEITKSQLIEVLKPIWETKHETASRLRGRIERILDNAAAYGYRSGINPALYKGNLEVALPNLKRRSSQHHPALNYSELPKFIESLIQVPGIASKALYFGILTAARSGEVRGAAWSEINWTDNTWTIPAHRMKAGKEHVIPLSKQALTLLKTCEPGRGDLIFYSKRGLRLSDATLAKVIKNMHQRLLNEGKSGWTDPDASNRVITPHGFRSTFRVWAADNIDLPSEIVEHALAHKLKDKVEAAYQRKTSLPKRIELMQTWASFCCSYF